MALPPIVVKLKDGVFTVDPPDLPVPFGNHNIVWKKHPDSDKFEFVPPFVTFDGSAPIPFKKVTIVGETVTCQDNNLNITEATQYTTYLHLKASHFIYPSAPVAANRSGPYISNQPKNQK